MKNYCVLRKESSESGGGIHTHGQFYSKFYCGVSSCLPSICSFLVRGTELKQHQKRTLKSLTDGITRFMLNRRLTWHAKDDEGVNIFIV